MLGDPRQHLRAYFFTIMECKNVIRPIGMDKNMMRGAVLPFDYRFIRVMRTYLSFTYYQVTPSCTCEKQ
jgi:hypothetical protein